MLTGLLPYPLLNDAAPVAVALGAHPQLAWLRDWVIIGALAGLTSVILVMMLAQARIFLSMSRHGLLPPIFGKVHPRFRTPHVATVITGSDRRHRSAACCPSTCWANWCPSARSSLSSWCASACWCCARPARICRARFG